MRDIGDPGSRLGFFRYWHAFLWLRALGVLGIAAAQFGLSCAEAYSAAFPSDHAHRCCYSLILPLSWIAPMATRFALFIRGRRYIAVHLAHVDLAVALLFQLLLGAAWW